MKVNGGGGGSDGRRYCKHEVKVNDSSALRNRRQIEVMHTVDERELTQLQDGWKNQDGRMTKKCCARSCIPGLA